MTESWYDKVDSSTRITQGDLILDCPLLTWTEVTPDFPADHAEEALRSSMRAISADVIVMTQACDLEQDKVSKVVLCPCFPISTFKTIWQSALTRQNQPYSDKAWRKQCESIRDGRVWNLTLLNSGEVEDLFTEVRVVDFHEIYTVPRPFLEDFINRNGNPRLRLRPPYREHLSQSFARYFMRVGLPVRIAPAW